MFKLILTMTVAIHGGGTTNVSVDGHMLDTKYEYPTYDACKWAGKQSIKNRSVVTPSSDRGPKKRVTYSYLCIPKLTEEDVDAPQ